MATNSSYSQTNLQRLISDLKVLCELCHRDVSTPNVLNVNYLTNEHNRIRIALTTSDAEITESINDIHPYNDKQQQLRVVEASANKLFARLNKQTTHDTLETSSILKQLFERFHKVVRQLRNRHNSRPTIDVKDEYDVQDLLHAMLRIYFDDIRPEEWTPSYCGGSSRMDFLLKNEQTVIEVKKTHDNLRDKQIGEELLVDINKYSQHPDCKTLICFIYDPEGFIANPSGLQTDLNKSSTGNLNVIVHIPT